MGLSRHTDFFIETGPYFAVGIAGKYKGSSFPGPDAPFTTWDYGSFTKENGNPSRFDSGWGIKTGLIFHSLQIQVGYQIGFCQVLKDIYPSSGFDGHNSNFTVGLAYMF